MNRILLLSRRTGVSLAALAVMSANALAAPACNLEAATALKTAALQQELMVAGLTCHDDAAYNRFVLDNQPALQKSDADLMDWFRNRDGNEAGYDSYKTKLANLAAGISAANGARFCASADATFASARSRPLTDFISSERLLVRAPEPCAVQYDRVDVADASLAGPSYALPATPYGTEAANPAPAAQRAGAETDDEDLPPPPPPRYRARVNNDDADRWNDEREAYGPPSGWLPPPRPRWRWYDANYGW